MTDHPKRVVLVGHCGFDAGNIRRAVRRAAPDTPIETVNDSKSLQKLADGSSLLLVNRILDGGFDAPTGVELIRDLAGSDAPPAMMLVSNYDGAQADAREAGALEGFGKSDLSSDATTAKLRRALGLDD